MTTENTAPESKILLNDAEIPPDLKADVLEAVVCQYLEGPNSFDIVVNIVGPENDKLRWVDDPKLQPGTKVEIKLGYLDQFAEPDRGRGHRPAPQILQHRERQDARAGLRQAPPAAARPQHAQLRGDEGQPDGGADRGRRGPDPAGGGHGRRLRLRAPEQQSDLDFLLERARRIRYEVRIDGQKLVFRRAANHLGKTVTLEFTKTLKQFCPRLTTVGQVSEVKVRAWNPATKEAVLGVARTGDEDTKMGGKESGPRSRRLRSGRRRAP